MHCKSSLEGFEIRIIFTVHYFTTSSVLTDSSLDIMKINVNYYYYSPASIKRLLPVEYYIMDLYLSEMLTFSLVGRPVGNTMAIQN